MQYSAHSAEENGFRSLEKNIYLWSFGSLYDKALFVELGVHERKPEVTWWEKKNHSS